MKAESQNLDGAALIWAMCLALGHSPEVAATGVAYKDDHGSWVYPRFTSDSEVGELMTKECIGVERPSKGQTVPLWRAITDKKTQTKYQSRFEVVSAYGETLGVAVCRAIVLSRCGSTVDVPEELLNK